MAVFRENPYSRFNYLVDIGAGTDGVVAGFQEVSGLGLEIAMAEYRNGNDRQNGPRKVPGLFSVSDVTLKRGVIGSLDLWEWIEQTRNGDAASARQVTIQLLDEARSQTVQAWTLVRARPTKYRGPLLAAQGNDVAIEELVLCAEDLRLE